MNFRMRVAFLTGVLLAMMAIFAPRAYAAEADGDDSLWEKIQSAGASAADYIDEHKDGWAESAKEGANAIADKAGELYESAKDTAPGAIDRAKEEISNAQQRFSDWNAGQQQDFYDWFENQTGISQNPPAEAPEESQPPVEEPQPPASDHAPGEDASVPDEVTPEDPSPDPDLLSKNELIVLAVVGLVLAAVIGAISTLGVLHLRDRQQQRESKRRRYEDHHSRERRR